MFEIDIWKTGKEEQNQVLFTLARELRDHTKSVQTIEEIVICKNLTYDINDSGLALRLWIG